MAAASHKTKNGVGCARDSAVFPADMARMKVLVRELQDGAQASVTFEHNGESNAMQDWHRLRGSTRVYWNYLAGKLINLLPSLTVKNAACRVLLGMRVGKNVSIGPDVLFDPFYPELITIEDNAIIGWNARILCHEFTERHVRIGKVTIGAQSLVGAFTTVRAGCSIGTGSVVGMGAVVTAPVPAGELWAGVPARRRRRLRTLL